MSSHCFSTFSIKLVVTFIITLLIIPAHSNPIVAVDKVSIQKWYCVMLSQVILIYRKIMICINIPMITHFRNIEWYQGAQCQGYVKEMIFVVLRTTMRVMPLPAIEKTIGKIKTKLHFKSILQCLYIHLFVSPLMYFRLTFFQM